jgi:hypothetical protein
VFPDRKATMSKRFLVLDLDNTLICSVPVSEFHKPTVQAKIKAFKKESGPNYQHVYMPGAFHVYARPGLAEFISFAFQHFHIVIFTMASLPYAWFIIKHLILADKASERRKKILAVLTEPQCSLSQIHAKEKTSPKHLSWLFSQHPELNLDPRRTFFLDDLECVRKKNPQQAVYTPAFDVLKPSAGHDRFMWEVQGELVKRTRAHT